MRTTAVVAIGAALLALVPSQSATEPEQKVSETTPELSFYRAQEFEGADTPFPYGPAPKQLPRIAAELVAEQFVAAHPDAVVELCPWAAGTPYLWGGGHSWQERSRACERFGRWK